MSSLPRSSSQFAGSSRLTLFIVGVAAVTVGVLLHAPMLLIIIVTRSELMRVRCDPRVSG